VLISLVLSSAEMTIPFFLKEIMHYIDDEDDKVSRNNAIFSVF
jgi:hypothetical protein